MIKAGRAIAFVIVLALAILLRDLLLFTLLSILLALLMGYPVGILSRWMPRGLAVGVVLIVGLALAGVFVSAFVPKITEQAQSVLKRLPVAFDSFQEWSQGLRRQVTRAGVPQAGQFGQKVGERVTQALGESLGSVIPAAKGLLGLVALVVLIVVMAAFLAARPDTYRSGLRKLVAKNREPLFDECYARIAVGLRRWLGGILAAMIAMGVLTAAGLWIAGIENWPLLGLLTLFATFVPYLGAISSAIPGILMALSQSPRHFLLACLVYMGVHICEGYIVEPIIMKRAILIPPAALLFGQTALLILFGLPGVVVAAPLLVCGKILIDYLYVERSLGKRKALHAA